MMVVVFSDKVQVIDQTHRLLQTRVQQCPREKETLRFPDTIHQVRACFAKRCQNPGQFASVVIGLIRFAVVQVRHGQGVAIAKKIFDARHPQWFQIQQMSRVFLRRPFLTRFAHQNVMGNAAQKFF